MKRTINHKALVSVNIRTFNSAKTLEETLASVKKQTYKNTEIIVSDGYSKDGTIDIARKYGARIYYADKLGDARIQVIQKSKGDYILSLDSDQVMDRNLIKDCLNLCLGKKYEALIISEKSFLTQGTFLEKLIAYDKYLIDKDRKGSKIFDTACPRFFSKRVLRMVILPEHLSIFDDTILYAEILKNNGKVGYLKKSAIWHHEVGSWRIFIKKFFRYGKGYLKAFEKNPVVITAHTLPRKAYFTEHLFDKPQYVFPLFILYIVKVTSAGLGAIYSIFENLLKKITA
jgi:glycosyltransferase involved in cell wall biosynthesis